MGKCHEAVADYKKVLDLEPSNKQAQSEMERLQKVSPTELVGDLPLMFTGQAMRFHFWKHKHVYFAG